MSAPENISGSNTISFCSSSTSTSESTRRRSRLSLSPSSTRELFNKLLEEKASTPTIEALQLEAFSKKKAVKSNYQTISRSAPISTREADSLPKSSKSSDIVPVSEWVHNVSITSPRSKFPGEIDIKEPIKSGPPKKPSPREFFSSLFSRRKEEEVLDFSQSYSEWQSYKTYAGWEKRKKEIKKKEPPRKNSSEADRPIEVNRKTSEAKTLNLKKLPIESDDFHFINYYFLNLTYLYLDGATVSDDDLKLLPKFHLQAIQLTNCPNISNRVCEALNEFWSLKALKVSLNPKKPVSDIENQSSEKSPERSAMGCNEELLIELAQRNIAKRIQELHLTPSQHLSTEAVEALGKFENLTILGLSHTFIPAESLHYLKELKLSVLKIDGYQDERDILLDIAPIWPDLNTLILNNCSFVTSKRLGTLNAFGLLERLSLENCPIDNSAIPFLNEMRALRYLFLKGCEISSNGLLNLNISHLHRLEISSHDKISLRALKIFLSSQTELQSFRLEWNSGSHFAKPSLRGIPEDFTSIQRKNPNFHVRDCLKFEREESAEFTNNEEEAWEKVKSSNKAFPNVRFLDLNGPDYVLNSDMALISQRYPYLTHLLLTGLDVTSAHLDKLLSLPLQALQLSECYYLSNSAAEILNLFPHLVALKLSLHRYDARYQRSVNLTEGILAEIAKRGLGQRLEELQIHPAKTLSEVGLEQIGKMTNLKTLSLSDVSPEVINKIGEHLGGLIHLSSCHLIDCSLSDDTATVICNLWPHIHTLSFDYCGSKFTYEGLAALASCRELTTLSLRSCGLDNQALIEQCKLNNLETVQHLNLSLNNLNGILSDLKLPFLKSIDLSSTKITDDELIKFIESQPKLKYIYLNSNSLLTDKALTAIGKLRKIRFIAIQKCPKITKKMITKLKKENSKIKVNHK